MNVPKVMLSVSTVMSFSSIVAIAPRSLRRTAQLLYGPHTMSRCTGASSVVEMCRPSPRLAAKMRHQDPHGPLSHRIRLQGRERPGLAVDPVRGQAVRLRTGSEQEMARRVQAEGAGPRFGSDLPEGRQPTGGGIDGEACDAVVAAVGRVQELPRGRHLNLGAGVAFLVPGG